MACIQATEKAFQIVTNTNVTQTSFLHVSSQNMLCGVFT